MLACTNGDVSRLTLCCALCGCVVPGWGGLGHGDKTQQELPGLVEQLAEDGHRVTQVSCGAKHTLALTDDGTVLCWGDGEFGRIGNGKSSAPEPEVVEELSHLRCKQVCARTPSVMASPCDHTIRGTHAVACAQVACGESYSAAVTEEGELYMWGKNDQSQLGLGANLTMDINSLEEFPLVNHIMKGGCSVVGALWSLLCVVGLPAGLLRRVTTVSAEQRLALWRVLR